MKYLTEKEVQEILQITPRKTRELFHTEGFPGVRIGKDYRIEESDLREYLRTVGGIDLDYNNKNK